MKIKPHYTENGKYKRIKEYNSWACIKARCNNPNNPYYKFYGGRGIKCLYSDFQEFINDIGFAPTPEHSVDRINNNGNYEIGNCRWATKKEQLSNTRRTVYVTKDGETKCLKEWARILGYSYGCIRKRYLKGQDIFAPLKEQYRTICKKHL